MKEEETVKQDKRSLKFLTWGFLVPLLIASVVAIALVLTWVYTPTDVLEVKNVPLPVREQVVHPNEPIVLQADFCKRLKVDGRLRISYVSSSREILLPVVPERGEAKCQNVEFPILVPKDLPPDTYRLNFRVTYDINPFKKGVVEEFQSKPFRVE